MRFKFRGIIKNGYEQAGSLLYFDLTDFIDSGLFGDNLDVLELSHIDFNTIDEFTGLLDINGKEIYENDIVMSGDRENNTGKVIFYDAAYWVQFSPYYDAIELLSNLVVKIIGNIHKNKKAER